MRRLTPLFIAIVVSAVLAGCFGGPDDGQPPPRPAVPDDWAELAAPFGEGHDHSDVAQHTDLSTPNFVNLGYDPLITDYHQASSGDYFCGDTGSLDGRQIAVTHSFNSDVAFVLVDVTDPTQPKKLGELVLPQTHVWDLAMMPDASYVALATSPQDFGPDRGAVEPPVLLTHDLTKFGPAPIIDHDHEDEHESFADVPLVAGADFGAPDTMTLTPIWRDACGNEFQGPTDEVAYASGVALVDISDLMTPTVVDYRAQPVLGGHSIHCAMVDGVKYVLVSVTNLFDQNSYFSLFTVEDRPEGGVLVPFAEYSASQPSSGAGLATPQDNGHMDGWIMKHPVTNQNIIFLADYNNGLVLLELSPTAQLTPIGQWNDYDPEKGTHMTGEIHTVLPFDHLIDGRHYTIAGQEVTSRPAGRPTGQVVLVDTTDPTQPFAVARWTFPYDLDWGPDSFLLFSPHYVENVGDYLYISHWHLGVFATKITPENWPELPTLGVFVPDTTSPQPPPDYIEYYQTWKPHVMDVLATEDGTLVIFDGQSGAYTLQFDPTVAVPTPQPWLDDAWLT